MFSIVLDTYDVIILKIQTLWFYFFAYSLILRWYIISENFIFLALLEHTQKIGGAPCAPHVWICSKSPMLGRVKVVMWLYLYVAMSVEEESNLMALHRLQYFVVTSRAYLRQIFQILIVPFDLTASKNFDLIKVKFSL